MIVITKLKLKSNKTVMTVILKQEIKIEKKRKKNLMNDNDFETRN